MASYVIEIDEKKVEEQINGILSTVLARDLKNRYGESGQVMSAAIKDLIYSHKDEIIEKVVDKASAEIVRKAMPKLLERLTEQ